MKSRSKRSKALNFVLIIGVMSFFADFTYEGARGIVGPYLAILGAGAFTIAFVTGFGEFVGYAWRIISGNLSDKTGKFWPIMIFGYVVQMASVPLLALAGNWQTAAILIVLERFGRATRNPPRDVMLSHAAKEMGYGWAFGVHEALDQFGALFGPLVAAGIYAWRGDYKLTFAMMIIPALTMLLLLAIARFTYPHPEELDDTPPNVNTRGLPRVFWIYLTGAVLAAAGFADYPFMAYHFQMVHSVSSADIPIFYAIAMGVSGAGSLLFGRLFDRYGIIILIPLTILSAFIAPLVFLGGFWVVLIGIILWGLGTGVHESIIPAAVALMVPVQRRASWAVHRRIRHFLVPRKSADRRLIRLFHPGCDRILYDCGIKCTASIFACQEAQFLKIMIFSGKAYRIRNPMNRFRMMSGKRCLQKSI